MVQMTPRPANITNALRQFTNAMTATTSSGVTAPPQRAPIHIIACARVRSLRGNHALNAFVRFGEHPASPAPNRNRVIDIEMKFHIQPVAAVKKDHQSTTRTSTLRAPSLSPSHPVGISNSAYANPNAEKM